MFHLTDDVLAEVDGIAHDLEGEGVLSHAGNDAEVAVRAAGDDHMVVVEAGETAVAIVIFDLGGGEVDSLHAFGAATDAGEHLAERGGGRVNIGQTEKTR